MEIQDALQLSGLILGSLGGGSAIIFGFSSWLGKVWANRLMEKEKSEHAQELESLRNRLTQDTESYKIKLKKSEFIFQKEFEAASEFIVLKRWILPSHSYPDMDWYDVCDYIANHFNNIEAYLETYLSKHGAVLRLESKNYLISCIGIAGENKFEISELGDVSRKANQAAEDLYKKLEKVEESLLEQVHSQSST